MLLLALGMLALAKLGLVGHGLISAAPPEAPPPDPPPADLAGLEPPPLPEPAAGPDEPPADDADEDAPREPPLDPTFGSDLDPEHLTASEITVLHQLAARRAALDARARELEERALLLTTSEARLAEQIERLAELHAAIKAAIEQHDAREDARIASLVKIYETMKAKAAAEIFNRLEMPVLLQVVERMREPKSADVLARMDPVKAKQVTAELARRRKLLEGAGGADDPARPDPGS